MRKLNYFFLIILTPILTAVKSINRNEWLINLIWTFHVIRFDQLEGRISYKHMIFKNIVFVRYLTLSAKKGNTSFFDNKSDINIKQEGDDGH